MERIIFNKINTNFLRVLRDKLEAIVKLFWPLRLKPYFKSALPSATLYGQLIFVVDATGGAIPAYSDGTKWRRVTDQTEIN